MKTLPFSRWFPRRLPNGTRVLAVAGPNRYITGAVAVACPAAPAAGVHVHHPSVDACEYAFTSRRADLRVIRP